MEANYKIRKEQIQAHQKAQQGMTPQITTEARPQNLHNQKKSLTTKGSIATNVKDTDMFKSSVSRI